MLWIPFALAAPPAVKLDLSGGVFGGPALHGANDLVEDAPLIGARAGLVLATWDVELAVARIATTTRAVPFGTVSTVPSLAILYHPDPRARFDLFAGGGVGWRHLQIHDPSGGQRDSAEALGLRTHPVIDLVAYADVGVTAWVWGPFHVRADVRGGVTAGDQPWRSNGHFSGYGDLVLGIDLRNEGPPDRDRDGVANRADRCPDSLEDHDGFTDGDGCEDPDDDGDGVPDVVDRCKDGAEDVDGFQDDDGCPDFNNDGDIVSDAQDRCPIEAEEPNGYEDGDGCPDEYPADLAAVVGVQRGYAFAEGALALESEPLLQALLAAMNAHPAIRISIEADWDGEGTSSEIRELTEKQAAAIASWLLARGIAADRVSSVGFGDTRVYSTDRTPEVVARGRRIEIRPKP